jgi:hypothetical protein
MYRGDPSIYATCRKQRQNGMIDQCIKTGSSNVTHSFRLPPPLSSSIIQSSMHNGSSLSSSRTRSLENINLNARKFNGHHEQVSIDHDNHEQYVLLQYTLKETDVKTTNGQILSTNELTSRMETTMGIPFANENIGTIKQRQPTEHYQKLSISSTYDPMKCSLPSELFQLSESYMKNTPMNNNEQHLSVELPDQTCLSKNTWTKSRSNQVIK